MAAAGAPSTSGYSRTWTAVTATIAFVVAIIGQWGVVPAYASTFSPSISSDLADYNPGGTVTLTGVGWDAAGSAVHVIVNDDDAQSWQHVADVPPAVTAVDLVARGAAADDARDAAADRALDPSFAPD